jgi:hypothetical protein
MKIRLFGCGKFRWLAIEKYDRDLSPREGAFYRKHREVCFTCMRFEQQGVNSMNLLRGAGIDPEISEGFDERVLSELSKSRIRKPVFGYWSPAYAGAALAALALFATLQLATKSAEPWTPNPNRQSPAYRFSSPQDTLPNLILHPENSQPEQDR